MKLFPVALARTCLSLALFVSFGSLASAQNQTVNGDLSVTGNSYFDGSIFSVQSNVVGSPNLFITKSDSGTPSQNGGALTFENYHLHDTGRNAGVISGSINFNYSQPSSGASQLGAQIQAVSDYFQSGGDTPTALIFGTFNSPYYSGIGSYGFAERMRISSNGNVGIGTSTPAAKLDVAGNANIQGTLMVAGSPVLTANGDGSGLTGLNASQLTSGTVSAALLPSTVVQTTTVQTLINKTLSGAILSGDTSVVGGALTVSGQANVGGNLNVNGSSAQGVNPAHVTNLVSGSGGALFGGIFGVTISGNYAYMSGGNTNSLQIVDITNPAAPVVKGSLVDGAGGAMLNFPSQIAVAGNYAYVASRNSNALEIIDVSNPSAPIHKGSLVDGAGGAMLNALFGVVIAGNYAYVAAAGSSALEVVDISNPAAPVHKGSLINGAGGALLANPQGVAVSGNYAYVTATGGSALEVVDISNPAAPVHKGSLINGAGGAMLPNPAGIKISGNYAYVANANNALEVIDISNPAAPVHKAFMANGAGGALLGGARFLDISGNYAYLGSTSDNVLEIVNLMTPKPNAYQLNGAPVLSANTANTNILIGEGMPAANVGIGTTVPQNTLDVGGTGLRVDGVYNENSTMPGVYAGIVNQTSRLGFFDGSAAQNWQVDNNFGVFRFYTPNNTVMQLQSSPNQLSVNGNIRLDGAMSIGSSPQSNIQLRVGAAGQSDMYQPSVPLYGIYVQPVNTSNGGVIGVVSDPIVHNYRTEDASPMVEGYQSHLYISDGLVSKGIHFEALTPYIKPGSDNPASLTNVYGLYINQQKIVGVTNAYGIYQLSTADANYFAGNVGIGTSTPSEQLEVTGNVKIGGALSVGGQSVATANQLSSYATTSQLTAYQPAIGSGAGLTNLNATQLTTGTVPTGVLPSTVVQTTTAGNVGIQTTTPQGALTIGSGQLTAPSGTAAAPTYTFNNNLNTGVYSSGANSVSVATNGVERLRVYANGNLASDDFTNLPGAASNSSYKVFHFASPTNSGSTLFSMASRNLSTAFFGNSAGTFVIGNEGARPIVFKNGLSYSNSDTLNTGTEKMRIDSNGNVGIGTSTPAATLDVVGTMQISGNIKVKNKAVIRISPSGDISMGEFYSGSDPSN